VTDAPPELPIVELTLVRFHALEEWATDADARHVCRARIYAGLAYAAALRGMRFDHAWPRVTEVRVDPARINDSRATPTHVMLYGRVWAVPND
jgi:hypothetical protein